MISLWPDRRALSVSRQVICCDIQYRLDIPDQSPGVIICIWFRNTLVRRSWSHQQS